MAGADSRLLHTVTQEQKKLRKQRREEREKEKQELIRQVGPTCSVSTHLLLALLGLG